MNEYASITKQVQIAVEFDHRLLVRHSIADGAAEIGEIGRDVRSSGARSRPERVLDLVSLHDDGSVREFADIARVIEMHVSENNVIDVGCLDPNLLKLGVDRKVGARAKVQQAGQRS